MATVAGTEWNAAKADESGTFRSGIMGAGKCGGFAVTKERLSGRSLKRQEKKGATLAGGVGAAGPRTWRRMPARLGSPAVLAIGSAGASAEAGAGLRRPCAAPGHWSLTAMSHAALPVPSRTRSGLWFGVFWAKGAAAAARFGKTNWPFPDAALKKR